LARYVSFRFDDGFIKGARTAAACLAPDYGTFFLIADLVTNGAADHPEPLFRGRDFGSPAEWRALARAGQDIQLHGRTHTDLMRLSPSEQRAEIVSSLAFTRELHDGPYVFCHPFNHRIDLDFAPLGLSGAGFRTRASDHPILFHELTKRIDPFALSSWAVRERHFKSAADQLRKLPDESWTILALHSLDGEGHEPWSVAAFRELVSECRSLGLSIVTVSNMIESLQPRP
jgi:peptidoglycan/xylan/chitin deacetylase (PgdA/CDA1 family)